MNYITPSQELCNNSQIIKRISIKNFQIVVKHMFFYLQYLWILQEQCSNKVIFSIVFIKTVLRHPEKVHEVYQLIIQQRLFNFSDARKTYYSFHLIMVKCLMLWQYKLLKNLAYLVLRNVCINSSIQNIELIYKNLMFRKNIVKFA